MKQEHPTYNKWKFLITFAITVALFASIRNIFDIKVPLLTIDNTRNNATVQQEYDDITEIYVGDDAEEPYEISPYDTITPPQDQQENTENTENTEITVNTEIAENTEITENTEDVETTEETETKQEVTKRRPHKIKGVTSWDKCFPDINDVQLTAARKNGIKPPLNRAEATELIRTNKLVNITNSPYYTVDDLTHSMPYLVPKAQQLLNTICLNFIDSLNVKGLPAYLPMITSALRTTADVSRLQKGNGNATTNSCHCYGTTVDISYNRFVPVSGNYNPNAELLRWDFKMKQILAEVLLDLREEGQCYVKYERKQGCFHLTVR